MRLQRALLAVVTALATGAGPQIAGLLTASIAHAAEPPSLRFSASVQGEGPDVILIPGLASSAHVWDVEAPRLKGYRLHILQIRGFAGAPAGANAEGPLLTPLVEALFASIQAEGLKRPAVVGHSLGGLVGLMLADRHPDALGQLLIVDALPFYGLLFSPNASVATVETQARAVRDALSGQSQSDFAASEPAAMARLIKSKGAAAEAAVAAAQASDHGVVARAFYEDLTTDLRPKLASIRTPVVILYPFDAAIGEPQAAIDGLYQGAFAPLPNKRLVRIDNAFHFIMIDQPEALHREIAVFLAR